MANQHQQQTQHVNDIISHPGAETFNKPSAQPAALLKR